MVRHAVDTYGGLDCAHNNAGIAAPMAPLADYPDDGWDRTLAVMLTGVYYCMKAEIPAMLERGGGAIVNTASGVGLVGYAHQAAYTASKHGVVGLTKVAALDYGAQGVRVNAMCPGTARTPMVDRALRHDPSIDEHLRALHPIGRIGEASEVAEAAVWLCTPAASFVLGVALPVDGGLRRPMRTTEMTEDRGPPGRAGPLIGDAWGRATRRRLRPPLRRHRRGPGPDRAGRRRRRGRRRWPRRAPRSRSGPPSPP